MSEDQSTAISTNTEVSGTGEQPVQASPQAVEQTSISQGQTASDGYNPKWYETDGRYGKIWKKETFTDDLAKSYYNLEKQYKPLAEQTKQYNTFFKENGIEFQKLPEIYKEYQTLKDPNNPLNQKASYLESWLSDPVYSPKVQSFFQEMEMAKLQEMYPGMNRDQIEKQMAMETELKAIREERQKQKDEEYIKNFSSQIEQHTEKNRKLAASVGLPYTEEIHNLVIDEIAKHDKKYGYPITAHEAYLSLYGDKIEAARVQKLEADFLKRQQAKGNSGSPAITGKPGLAPMSLKDKFRQVLNAK